MRGRSGNISFIRPVNSVNLLTPIFWSTAAKFQNFEIFGTSSSVQASTPHMSSRGIGTYLKKRVGASGALPKLNRILELAIPPSYIFYVGGPEIRFTLYFGYPQVTMFTEYEHDYIPMHKHTANLSLHRIVGFPRIK